MVFSNTIADIIE